jgi:hypothetical protein
LATEFNAETVYYKLETSTYKNVTTIKTSNGVTIPNFIPNYYYKKDVASDEYIRLTAKPSDWDSKSTSGGVSVYNCTNYYYCENPAKYVKVSNITEENFKNGTYYTSTATYPVIKTTQPLQMTDMDLYYSAVGSVSGNSDVSRVYTQLPPLNVIDSEYKWNVFAYLNINISPTTPQILPKYDVESKSICTVTIGDTTFSNATNSSVTHGDKDLYLVSDVPVNKTGGEYVDVSWLNMLGESMSTNISSYTLNPSVESNTKLSALEDIGATELSVNHNVTDNVLISGMSLDKSYYHILPIELITDDLEVEIYLSSGNSITNSNPQSCKCCGTQTLTTAGKHFIQIPNDTKTMQISYKNKSDKSDSAIRFYNMFKYKHRDLFGNDVCEAKYGIDTTDVEGMIKTLDVPCVFDYCHRASGNSLINDPLDPVSVFNENHVFHNFAIPRAELRTAKPFTTTIDFVNTR